jgi:hypothetical protein
VRKGGRLVSYFLELENEYVNDIAIDWKKSNLTPYQASGFPFSPES